jgi:hypothetical protein
MNISNSEKKFLIQDIAIIFLSIIVAVILVKTEILTKILTSTKELELIGIATLGEIARANSVWLTALFGGIGAVVGDMIIFRFVRDRLSEHLMELIKHEGGGKRVRALFRLRSFRWFTALVGGLIIASPLPDELGISLLGCEKMKTSRFIPLSFVFNFLGIFLIGLIAKAI